VILLHGWIGSWRYWIPTMQVLQMKYRVYAIDLYGFGDSGKDPNRYSLEHQIALLADFMQELGIPKAAMVGHGLGALIITEYARRYSDRVPRMLIVDAPLFDPGDLERRVPAGRRVLQQRPAMPEPEDAGPNAPTVMSASAAMRAALLEAARARSGSLPPELEKMARATAEIPMAGHSHNPLLALMDSPEALLAKAFRRSEPNYERLAVDLAKIDPGVLRKSVENFDAGRMLDSLRLLATPTLIIHGVQDPIIPMPSEEILNYITLDKENLMLPILLPNVRHFPMLEDDRFPRLVTEFLEVPDVSRLEVKERWRRRTR
jgi:pimeloyl-ACP methyl ester carboxylesterase